MSTKLDGADKVSSGHRFANLNTAATTTVHTGKGVLHKVTINTPNTGTITIYDNTAGSGTTIAAIGASAAGPTYLYDIEFSTGLTFVVAATAPDITVSYSRANQKKATL